MFFLNLDCFHQAADNLTPLGKIGLVQSTSHLGSEILQLPQHQSQLFLLQSMILGCRGLLFV